MKKSQEAVTFLLNFSRTSRGLFERMKKKFLRRKKREREGRIRRGLSPGLNRSISTRSPWKTGRVESVSARNRNKKTPLNGLFVSMGMKAADEYAKADDSGRVALIIMLPSRVSISPCASSIDYAGV